MTYLEGPPRLCNDCEHYGMITRSCKERHRLPTSDQSCSWYFSLKVAPCGDCDSYREITVSCGRGNNLPTTQRCPDHSSSRLPGNKTDVSRTLGQTGIEIIHVDFGTGQVVSKTRVPK